MTTRKLSSAESLSDLKRDYLATLVAPLDGMWESGLIPAAPHWEIRLDDERAGYFCLDDEHRLLQLHVVESVEGRAQELFGEVISRHGVAGAIVSTVEPSFLSLCLDRQRSLRVHSYLYQEGAGGDADTSDDEFADATFERVRAGEQPAIEAYQRACFDDDLGTWLTGYLANLIGRGELWALRRGGELLATGECRVSESQPPYADLGMIVGREHRRRGVASHVLRRLKALCRRRELVPICSTTAENVGARKAIARAGFVSRHRILEVSFECGAGI